jgi:cephalosporin hydroxylase
MTSETDSRQIAPRSSILDESARLLALIRRFLTVRYRKLYLPEQDRRRLISAFVTLYYEEGYLGGAWSKTSWLGRPVAKCPLDILVLQDIIWETQPSLIIETGTAHGGSALFYATLCDLIGKGNVISIDIHQSRLLPEHARIRYIPGSSVSPTVIEQVRACLPDAGRVMVVLDSNHEKDHVLAELRNYGKFVSLGCYLIVEDTCVNGHPVLPTYGPGPMEAVEQFLMESSEFRRDPDREGHLLTFNPGGYLLKISDPTANATSK